MSQPMENRQPRPSRLPCGAPDRWGSRTEARVEVPMGEAQRSFFLRNYDLKKESLCRTETDSDTENI